MNWAVTTSLIFLWTRISQMTQISLALNQAAKRVIRECMAYRREDEPLSIKKISLAAPNNLKN
jgi:hypothetical protein